MALEQKSGISENNNLLSGLSIPAEVVAQQKKNNGKIDDGINQRDESIVNLFFSFDIVNSTKYKASTSYWPVVLKALLEYIIRLVTRDDDLTDCFLWRVIGDEIVFVLPIHSIERIPTAIDAIYRIVQEVAFDLKHGVFFDNVGVQSLSNKEVATLKIQNILSIKAAAWIAVVNSNPNPSSPYDNIELSYSVSHHAENIYDYIGPDIDTGFRLKSFTQRRRLVLGFELAYLLSKSLRSAELKVISYQILKGVWGEHLYPVIWYYNSKIVATGDKAHETINFIDSFSYDESVNNPIVREYFAREKEPSRTASSYDFLPAKMYSFTDAARQIIRDQNLSDKIEYIEKILSKKTNALNTTQHTMPLELHCAVVCCDVESRKIMIVCRGSNHKHNCGKWEFGCAKASSQTPLKKAICDYYYDTFGVKIELVCATTRSEKQPLPLAIYEVPVDDILTKKGIILVGRVTEKKKFRANLNYSEAKWVTFEEVQQIDASKAVTDFFNTAKQVFEKFDEFFR